MPGARVDGREVRRNDHVADARADGLGVALLAEVDLLEPLAPRAAARPSISLRANGSVVRQQRHHLDGDLHPRRDHVDELVQHGPRRGVRESLLEDPARGLLVGVIAAEHVELHDVRLAAARQPHQRREVLQRLARLGLHAALDDLARRLVVAVAAGGEVDVARHHPRVAGVDVGDVDARPLPADEPVDVQVHQVTLGKLGDERLQGGPVRGIREEVLPGPVDVLAVLHVGHVGRAPHHAVEVAARLHHQRAEVLEDQPHLRLDALHGDARDEVDAGEAVGVDDVVDPHADGLRAARVLGVDLKELP